MKTKRAWRWFGVAAFGLGCITATGCQTNVAGMTLPSGHYLQHPPQYFPPSPAFPLQRELAAMEAQAGGPGAAIGGGALPVPPQPAPLVPPVPQPGGALPPPVPAPNR